MPDPSLPVPTPDELDDLIYTTRAGDLPALTSLISSLCALHAIPPSVLLASAIDIDADDGLGSQSSLLHYPAANGNLEVLQHLLGLLSPSASLGRSPGATVADKSAPQLVNHRNVSGNTPLHWAGMNGHVSVVEALVQAGADCRVRNEMGRDCIVEAEVAGENGREGCAECVVWMLQHCEGSEEGIGAKEEGEEEAESKEAKNGHSAIDKTSDIEKQKKP